MTLASAAAVSRLVRSFSSPRHASQRCRAGPFFLGFQSTPHRKSRLRHANGRFLRHRVEKILCCEHCWQHAASAPIDGRASTPPTDHAVGTSKPRPSILRRPPIPAPHKRPSSMIRPLTREIRDDDESPSNDTTNRTPSAGLRTSKDDVQCGTARPRIVARSVCMALK